MKIIKKQNGAVLIISMVMLSVLSIIVISASSTTTIQQKMTTNLRVKEITRQVVESTMKQAEADLLSTRQKVLNKRFEDAAGYYFFDKKRRLNTPKAWHNLQVITSHILQVGVKPPVYIIEKMPAIKTAGNSLELNQLQSSHYYRITIMAQAGTKSAISILQSIVKK